MRGGGEPVAEGPRTFHYCCRISDRVDYDLEAFATIVDRILQDDRGWRRWGFRFAPHRAADEAALRRRHRGQFFSITLEADDTIAEFGDGFRGMSVANCTDNEVSINFTRWLTGAKRVPGDPVLRMRRRDYRTYVILHEVGHILSRCHPGDHKTCERGPAPVMLQQTNGVGKCTPNAWPLAGIDNTLAEQARPIPSRDQK